MAKKMGEVYYTAKTYDQHGHKEPKRNSKPVWGDIYEGDEDSEVLLWGIINFNIPANDYKNAESLFEDFREYFTKETGFKLKKKVKKSNHGSYVKLYVPRPADKMNEVAQAFEDLDYDGRLDIEIEMDETNFDRIKRAEVSKAI